MSGTNKWTPLGPDCIIDGQMDEGGGRAPVSGRVTSIVLDGANVYVGTAGGGVWFSDDLGVKWTPLDDRQASLAVGAMVLDPATKCLYIGTGEGNSGGRMQHGQGLLIYDTQTKSFKPRVTAIPSPVPGDPTVVTRYKMLRTSAMLLEPATPGNPKRLWMGTTNGLFYSIDDGQHWLTSSLNGAANQIVSSLALVQDAGGQQLLAAWWGTSDSYDNGAGGTVTVRYNGGVFRKKADQTFDALPRDTEPSNKLPNKPVGRVGMAVAPSNAQCVYVLMASNGTDDFFGLYRSDDGGQTWSKRQLPGDSSRKLKQSNYNLTLAVHPTTPDTLILGEKALWRSTDGGNNWTCISAPSGDSPGTHSDQHAVVYDPAHPDRVWLGNDGGIWLSEDGGTTWKQRNRGLNTLQYYAMVHHTGAESVLLAGAQDNGTQRFAGHAGWNLVGYGDGFFCGIDAQDPRYWYSSYCYRNGSGDLSGIKRSDEAGAITSWSEVTDGIDGAEYASQKDEPFYVPFILDPVTSSTIYLGTTRLWRSHNRGASWQAVAKADGTVFTTATSVLPKKPTQHQGISAICVDPNDPKIIYVGARDGRIFQVVLKTFDADGKVTDASWSAAASPANPPTLDVVAPGDPDQFLRSYCTDLAVPKLSGPAPLPNRPVYVAYGSDYLSWNLPQHICQGRVWKVDFSNVATPVWTPLGTNGLEGKFPEPPHLIHQQNFANALAIDPLDPQHIFVGCHIGVYESKDGGSSWQPFLDGLPNVPVVDLQFHPTKRLLRAATMGRSVWERPVEDIAAPDRTDADVFIRDNIVDLGRYATHATADDPLNPPNQVKWLDGVDIKVDSKSLLGNLETPLSTQDYSGSGPIDYIAFQQLEHEAFVRGRQSRIYVQMSNRGPKKATEVVVRLYWARMSGDTIPALPANFWAGYPNANPGVSDVWQAVAPKGTLDDLPAGSPRVLHFDFTPPDESVDLALMAVMSSKEDPVNGSGTDVAAIAQANKRVVVRRVPVGYSTAEIVITILVVAGLAAGATAAAVAAS